MWNCGLFNQHTTAKLTTKAKGDKMYTSSVIFFNKKVSHLEAYESASGNKNEFNVAHAAVRFTKLLNSHNADSDAVAAALLQHDNGHALVMNDLQEEMTTHANNDTS